MSSRQESSQPRLAGSLVVQTPRLHDEPTRALRELPDDVFAASGSIANPVWLDELFRRNQARMRGCAHRMLKPAEVDDAVQEMAVRVLRALPTFRHESALSTWIYAIARHTCLDMRRRRAPEIELDDASPNERSLSTRIDDPLDESIIACRTAVAIAALPEPQHTVLVLRLGLGLSTAETAQRLVTTQDSVRSSLKRARSSLRDALSETMNCPRCGPGTYSLDADGVVTPDAS